MLDSCIRRYFLEVSFVVAVLQIGDSWFGGRWSYPIDVRIKRHRRGRGRNL